MQCIRPIKCGFDQKGNITFSEKQYSKQFEAFQICCRKCLPCRLNTARDKAIRAYHEAREHSQSMFLTLTYRPEDLKSPWLDYGDFQRFIRSLRDIEDLRGERRISYYVTGEYGEENKRPHWHAIIFGYEPADKQKKYVSDRGDQVYKSEFLDSVWGKGSTEYGDVTIDSAGYVARYAAKKLVHGNDQDHPYQPIHRTSSKYAIGKSYIEKYYKDVFRDGFVVLPTGEKAGIPRYYKEWFKENHPDEYAVYCSTVRQDIIDLALEKARKEDIEYQQLVIDRKCKLRPMKKKNVKETILQSKFKQLQERLKL